MGLSPHLKQFLKDVAQRSGARSVHLIAHSMGNRALTSALRELAPEIDPASPPFHEGRPSLPRTSMLTCFVATLPRRSSAPAGALPSMPPPTTRPLFSPSRFTATARAGDTGDGLVVIKGIETIDVSAVDTSLLGHNYYGDNATVISDMIDLVRNSKSAQERSWLETARLDDLFYWVFSRRSPNCRRGYKRRVHSLLIRRGRCGIFRESPPLHAVQANEWPDSL